MSNSELNEELSNKALVVDDIKTNRFILVKLLKKAGVGTVEAEDGQQAVDFCKKTVYSMIFMDIDMPVMDGLEATKKIRSLVNGSEEVPIVAITAGGVRATEEICLEARMNDYYKKPIYKEIINQIIENWYPCDLEK